jgi:hypothetical protein
MACNRCWGNWLVVLACGALAPGGLLRGDETDEQRAARIRQMSGEDKAALLGKKERFESLTALERSRLEHLYGAVSRDPAAQKLEETIRRYNKWLADLSSGQRAAIVGIADPKERVTKIKELMRKQEEDRFRQFVQAEVKREDQDAIYNWLEQFVLKHEKVIIDQLPSDWQRRIEDSPDETARRRNLITGWQFHVRRDSRIPAPSKEDYDHLLAALSDDARKRIDAVAKVDERDRRLNDLVGGAISSRFYPRPTREELHKFYVGLKTDDPRRERLEGLERDQLYGELQRMYQRERWGGGFYGRGGRGGRGQGPGPGSRGDGGEIRGERPEFKSGTRVKIFEGKRPPPDDLPPPPGNP